MTSHPAEEVVPFRVQPLPPATDAIEFVLEGVVVAGSKKGAAREDGGCA